MKRYEFFVTGTGSISVLAETEEEAISKINEEMMASACERNYELDLDYSEEVVDEKHE